MKILVTGSGGFIGRHLVYELLADGHDVAGADVAIADLPIREYVGNLATPGTALELIAAERPDVCVHLAAQVGRLFGEADIVHTIASNAQMTALLARVCGERGVRMVYASTSEVYGDRGESHCREDGPMVLPHNLYGLSKRWGEEACALYAPRDLTILRLSMPYGPGHPPGRGRAAITNMLWQAHNRLPIPVHIGAERSWCWIGDTVRGIRLIIEKGRGPYNVGRDDARISMRAVADMACEMTGAPLSLIEQTFPPPNQTVVKRLFTERLRGLGWEPKVDLMTGMALVYEWVKHFDAYGQWVEEPAGAVAQRR